MLASKKNATQEVVVREQVIEKQDKQKLTYKEKEEFKKLEKEMEALELEKTTIATALSSPETSNQQLIELGQRLSVIVDDLELKTMRWFELSEKM